MRTGHREHAEGGRRPSRALRDPQSCPHLDRTSPLEREPAGVPAYALAGHLSAQNPRQQSRRRDRSLERHCAPTLALEIFIASSAAAVWTDHATHKQLRYASSKAVRNKRAQQ
ncbi:hypothetical protein MTO96_017218 [Rhipicephalus appendiculatus]